MAPPPSAGETYGATYNFSEFQNRRKIMEHTHQKSTLPRAPARPGAPPRDRAGQVHSSKAGKCVGSNARSGHDVASSVWEMPLGPQIGRNLSSRM